MSKHFQYLTLCFNKKAYIIVQYGPKSVSHYFCIIPLKLEENAIFFFFLI